MKKPNGRTYAELTSSCGSITFDPRTGVVVATSLDKDFGPKPVRIDVDEWVLRYSELVAEGSSHDVLDFGYWTRTRYETPCEDWRTDLAKLRLQERQVEALTVDERLARQAFLEKRRNDRNLAFKKMSKPIAEARRELRRALLVDDIR